MINKNQNPLRVLCIGAGAIGAYVGGSLCLAGHQVVFLTKHKRTSHDLHLLIDQTEYSVTSPPMTTALEEALKLGPFDVAILAVKSYDTQSILSDLSGFSNQFPPLLCLQNGVDNESAITQVLGPGKVIYGTVTSAVSKSNPNTIILERLRGIGIAAGHPLAEKLVLVLSNAGLNASLYKNHASMKWSKLLVNLIGNASSAILDLPPADIYSHPGLYRLEIAQLRETLAVMSEQGHKVVNLPGTPVRALAFVVQRLPLSVSRILLQKLIGKGRGDKMPSFHIDLYSDRGKSEVEFLNGAVVRAGESLGISTPVNSFLCETLTKLTQGKIAIDTYRKNPSALIKYYSQSVQ